LSTLSPTETFKPKHPPQADSNFLLFDPSCHFLLSARRRNSVYSDARGLKSKSYRRKNSGLVEAGIGAIESALCQRLQVWDRAGFQQKIYSCFLLYSKEPAKDWLDMNTDKLARKLNSTFHMQSPLRNVDTSPGYVPALDVRVSQPDETEWITS